MEQSLDRFDRFASLRKGRLQLSLSTVFLISKFVFLFFLSVSSLFVTKKPLFTVKFLIYALIYSQKNPLLVGKRVSHKSFRFSNLLLYETRLSILIFTDKIQTQQHPYRIIGT